MTVSLDFFSSSSSFGLVCMCKHVCHNKHVYSVCECTCANVTQFNGQQVHALFKLSLIAFSLPAYYVKLCSY